jgi:hypothetical protein
VMLVGEQVGLDGATRFHRCRQQQDSGRCNFTKSGRDEVFRGAHAQEQPSAQAQGGGVG